MFKILSGYNEDLVFNGNYDALLLPHLTNGGAISALSSYVGKNFPEYLKLIQKGTGDSYSRPINKTERMYKALFFDKYDLANDDGLLPTLYKIDEMIADGYKNIILPCVNLNGHFPDIDKWALTLNQRYGHLKDVTVSWYFSNHFKHFSEEIFNNYEIEVIEIANNYYMRLTEEGLNVPLERTRVVQSCDSTQIIWRGNYVREQEPADICGKTIGTATYGTGCGNGNSGGPTTRTISANPYKLLHS